MYENFNCFIFLSKLYIFCYFYFSRLGVCVVGFFVFLILGFLMIKEIEYFLYVYWFFRGLFGEGFV